MDLDRFAMRRASMLAVLVLAVPGIARAQCSNTPGATLQVTDVADGLTATQLAATLVGNGVFVSNAVFTGNGGSAGTFTDSANVSGIPSGVVLSSGCAKSAAGPNDTDSQSQDFGTPGDAQLSALISGLQTNDASVLEFDFVPTTSQIVLRYVFASDEYNEYANSNVNDVFGLFVNGTNLALLPDNTTVISINTVNGGDPFGTGAVNPEYYRNNDPNDPGATLDIEPDGLTVVLTLTASVTPYATNHFKIALADGGDSAYNSWIFIENQSLSATGCGNGLVAGNESCDDGNLSNGDGCSSGCTVEDCWTCSGEPSVCTPQAPTIATVESAGSVGRYANMTIGSDGLPIIAYYDDTNDRIKAAHCSDAACTSAAIHVVDSTVGDILGWQHAVRVEVGSDGLPFIAYYSATAQLLRLAHCDDLACTTSNRINMDIGQTNSGMELGLAIGADGYPLVTHGEPSQNWRRVVHCLSHDCVLRDTYTAGQPGYRYGHTAVGADGLGLSAHGTGAEIRINHCNNVGCSSSTDAVVLTGGGVTPWIAATDLALAPNGRGFFTYHDGETSELRVARCANAACTSVATSLVDGAVGLTEGLAASSSILFASDGRARIAYYDTDDGDLRLAECLDVDCTTSTLRTLDSTGDVGRDASMVRSGSRLLVSYFDTTNSDLKVAYCAGASGDGIVDGDEECDDGNFVLGDGCDASGQVETCYDCSGSPSACTSHCGNGVLDPDESCDDGNLVSGDGCSPTGTAEPCYTCAGEPSTCTTNCGSDGALDPTFDGDGRVTTVFTAGVDQIRDVAFQSDGRIVAVGSIGPVGSRDFAIARYNVDGSLDTTFSGDGKLEVSLLGDDIALAVAIQSDSKIVVTGFAESGAADLALVRLNSDGTFDTTFSGDGIQTSDFGVYELGFDVAIQTDGKIVVGGTRGTGVQNDALVARYNADGTLDSTFSGDGVDILDVYGTSTTDLLYALVIQPDGRIVVGGSAISGGLQQFTLLRYNTNGTLDTSFSGDGKASIPIGSGVGTIRGIVLQPDGRIVAAGDAMGWGSNMDFAVARFHADGSPDTTFSGDGKLLTTFGSADDGGRSVALRGDGRIVVAGYGDMSGKWNFAVARYLADGQLDSSFAGDGRATTAVGTGQDIAFGVGIDSMGRTVAAGQSYYGSSSAFAIVRYAEAVCGDGNIQAGEQCDDGNVVGGDCCSASCLYEAAGLACASDGLACSTDLCDGVGACVHAAGNAGTTCRASAGVCDVDETCDGVSTACPADAKSTSVCRGAMGECDLAESCDGVSDSCPADARKGSGTSCTSDGNVCTNDVCDGSSVACTHPANTVPCNDGQFCNGADTCSGGSCSVHVGDPCVGGSECANACNEVADNCFDLASTPCPADGNVCTDDVCDGAGGCGVNNAASCNDGVYCNGADTCAGGACTHAGSPCPETDCNTCQETTDSCFDPAGTACLDEPDRCTNDRCDGAGACEHTPIALAEVCNWAVVAGNADLASKVRTRLSVAIGGGVCADRADVGVNTSLDDGSWAMQREAGATIRFRGAASVGTGSVATAGGCVKGSEGILDTGYTEICCEDGIVPLAGGGVVHACTGHADLDACTLAREQVTSDIQTLDDLAATQALDAQNCSLQAPCTITAGPGLNVIDVPKVLIQAGAVLTVDGGGHADSVVILRTARGIKGKPDAQLLLAGGLDASRFAIYASDGSCKFGDDNVGSGTLFCPNGKVQFKLNTVWHGSIGAGSGVNLNDFAVLDHVPFLGLAD